LEADGRSNCKNLLFRREWPFFYAFDLLALEGEDLRGLPLLERKRCLRRIMPRVESRLRFMEHIEKRGIDLFRIACERDMEGIVGKWKPGSYSTDGRTSQINNLDDVHAGQSCNLLTMLILVGWLAALDDFRNWLILEAA
jgi:hypothetical protein